ncbi:MAG: T9SS type A sorting domain-containing protein [Saprospiraceae bacterium]
MKHLLILFFLSQAWLSYSQLKFVEVRSPNDFNLAYARKSPIGEYFIQTSNDRKSIYTSMDGHTWTNDSLPQSTYLKDIQFYSDGTPVLQPAGNEHLIRRDGKWYPMTLSPGFDEIEATFIKDDTLFAYDDQVFAYSIDKGQSFTILFEFQDVIIDHTAHLWKFDHYFVLHHAAGTSDTLSVFSESGERVLLESLALSVPSFLFNTCGEVLLFENFHYYLLREQGLTLTQGTLASILPTNPFDYNLLAQGGNYYYRDGSTIYQSSGCDFNWEILVSHNLIDSLRLIWINQQGDILLYNYLSDSFFEKANASNTWENHLLNVDYALVKSINESSNEHQITLTSNSMFRKNIAEPNWMEVDSPRVKSQQVLYSPVGDLYVNNYDHILYSKDNGQTFTTILLPNGLASLYFYSMYVPDNDIIVLLGSHNFYTLNNGQDWMEIQGLGVDYLPQVKLVDNFIIISILGTQLTVARINITTKVTTIDYVDDFDNLDFFETVILDDGTIYFQTSDFKSVDQPGLYRYRFEEGLEFIGTFWEIYYSSLISSGDDLFAFAFDGNGYYLFNGLGFDKYSFVGLPRFSNKQFIVSDNEFLYVIVDDHRIFRSTEPLSYPNVINGTIYHADADCISDTPDTRLAYWQVKVESDDYMRIKESDSEGNYRFNVPDGNYTLSSQPINPHWELCDIDYHLNVNEDHVDVHQDFLAKSLSACAEIELDFSTTLLRRCFENYYSIRVRNTGPDASAGTSLILQLDHYFYFVSADIPYTQVETGIIKFELGSLAVNEEITFRIYFSISCEAAIGTEHCLTGTLYDNHDCYDSRSTYTECQENVGSVDPNDKRIFNEAGKETEQVDKGEYIYYNILFQNTGTDTAFTVKIIDPLSPILDLGTLEMLSSSQPYSYIITDGPSLFVLFENILLPDSSTNETASHGFIKFRIKPLPAFDYGTSIPNQADIYFDFNEAVSTNEATLILLPPLATHETKRSVDFSISPNPVHQSISLAISTADRNRIDSYEIIDHLGQSVVRSKFLDHSFVDVSQLTPGIYMIVLKENGTSIGVKRFAKI